MSHYARNKVRKYFIIYPIIFFQHPIIYMLEYRALYSNWLNSKGFIEDKVIFLKVNIFSRLTFDMNNDIINDIKTSVYYILVSSTFTIWIEKGNKTSGNLSIANSTELCTLKYEKKSYDCSGLWYEGITFLKRLNCISDWKHSLLVCSKTVNYCINKNTSNHAYSPKVI